MFAIAVHIYTLDEAFEQTISRYESTDKAKIIKDFVNSFSACLSGAFVNHFKIEYIMSKGFVKCDLDDVNMCFLSLGKQNDSNIFDTYGYFYNTEEIDAKTIAELSERFCQQRKNETTQ